MEGFESEPTPAFLLMDYRTGTGKQDVVQRDGYDRMKPIFTPLDHSG